MTSHSLSTRRQFVRQATMAAAGAWAVPYFIPSSVLGNASVAPSDRIVMGCVGTGGMGIHDMKQFMKMPEVQVVAVCDVQDESNLYYMGATCGRKPARKAVEAHYAEQAKSGSFRGCEAYADFHDLVARKDIDAVCVTTPDHWHALASVAAANSGKDIYCEKPLANSIGEGRAICEAVQKNGRVLQTGSHERSGNNARFACELVQNGRIGKLHTIRINLPCGEWHHNQVLATKEMPPAMDVPTGFDFDTWLGHTAKARYTEKRCHFWWRFILSYGGGEMTDRGAHVIDLAQLGAGTDDTGPVTIEAKGIRSKTSLYDAFMEFEFVNTYANGLRMIGQTDGPRGLKFEGTDGWIFVHVHGGKLEAEPASLLQETIGDDEIQLGRSPGHHRNFIDSVKSRKQPVAPAEVGHRTASVCHLNNIAMRLGRKLQWDPVKEQFENDGEANRMVTPTMREPWRL